MNVLSSSLYPVVHFTPSYPIQVARLFVLAHRSRTKTRATRVNYKKVSYFELQRIFMSSIPKRIEIKQPVLW